VRHFSPPPPPSDAAAALEELNAFRVREKLQGERQDRQELLNKMDGIAQFLSDKIGGVEKSLNDKMGTNFQAMNVKIDSTKVDISVRAAGYALAGGTVALSALGFFFEKKVAVVDARPVLS
jgi:hypothetical protein